MDKTKLMAMLISHEGSKLFPYRCPAGKLTIGIGRNIEDNGISEEEALFLLNNDIKRVKDELINKLGSSKFNSLPENIQLVLMDMCFNMGISRLSNFKKMFATIENNDWSGMIKEMKNSSWYNQVGVRSKNLVKLIEEV